MSDFYEIDDIEFCYNTAEEGKAAKAEVKKIVAAMQARIEGLETAANKAVEWLHHYPSPDNMEEQMVMNAKRARGILEEALK